MVTNAIRQRSTLSSPLLRSTKRSFATTCRRRTHYETLGVSQGASKSQIKSHFYKLSKLHHPDVSKSPESDALFRKASDAYSVLANDRERRAYDRTLLHRAPIQSQQSFHPRAPPSRTSRASHAWEFRPRGPRKPPPDYVYPTKPEAGTNPNLRYSNPQAYRHSLHHDILTGTRRRAEEGERELDKVRRELPLVRAFQVSSLLLLGFFIFSGFGG